MNKYSIFNIAIIILTFSLSACIENDIPYPIVKVEVTDFEVEGIKGNATIDNSHRTITVDVLDTVNIQKLKITKFAIKDLESPEVTLDVVTPESCMSYNDFPRKPFTSLNNLPNANTCVDFSKDSVDFRFHTYQDYIYTVKVNQIIEREIEVTQQYGDAKFDAVSHIATIDIPMGTDSTKLFVNTFELGGKCEPNPQGKQWNFIENNKFNVTYRWPNAPTVEWTVKINMVKQDRFISINQSTGLCAHTTKVFFKGNAMKPESTFKSLDLQYKKEADNDWKSLNKKLYFYDGKNFEDSIIGLDPNTIYNLRFIVNDKEDLTLSFQTTEALPLNNGNFDEWSEGKNKYNDNLQWNPFKDATKRFWDSGNPGSTLLNVNTVLPDFDNKKGNTGYAAKLTTEYVLIKYAAGSIFTGEFVDFSINGGLLNFGQQFESFPTRLKINYKYAYMPKEIKINNEQEKDSCHIYIALSEKPFIIDNGYSEKRYFDKNAKEIIAYAEVIDDKYDNKWYEKELVLQYRDFYRKPKYIIIVATSSISGDYFKGKIGSTLWVDNFSLEYD